MEDLERATVATLDELSQATWFSEVGKPLKLDPSVEDKVYLCKTWDEAITHCSKISWENIQIKAGNTLSRRVIQVSPERFKVWNEVAGKVRPLALELVASKIDEVKAKKQLPQSFEHRVKWDIIHLLMEAEYSDIVQPAFFAAQSYWYVTGRFPCGWKGEFPNGKLVVF